MKKVILTIGSERFLMSQKDAMAAMNAVASALIVEWDTRRALTDEDFRRHYIVRRRTKGRELSLEVVDDDQIHIPPDLADEIKSAPEPRKAASRRIAAARQPLLLAEPKGSR